MWLNNARLLIHTCTYIYIYYILCYRFCDLYDPLIWFPTSLRNKLGKREKSLIRCWRRIGGGWKRLREEKLWNSRAKKRNGIESWSWFRDRKKRLQGEKSRKRKKNMQNWWSCRVRTNLGQSLLVLVYNSDMCHCFHSVPVGFRLEVWLTNISVIYCFLLHSIVSLFDCFRIWRPSNWSVVDVLDWVKVLRHWTDFYNLDVFKEIPSWWFLFLVLVSLLENLQW